jgi:hypothetical protein
MFEYVFFSSWNGMTDDEKKKLKGNVWKYVFSKAFDMLFSCICLVVSQL